MIEHLDRSEARLFLAEVRRVLRPGGVVRIAAPDLSRLVRDYVATGNADELIAGIHMGLSRPVGLRERAKWTLVGPRHHLWMYDGESLTRLLGESGFKEAAVTAAGTTRIAEPGQLDLREREVESVYVEAIKPLSLLASVTGQLAIAAGVVRYVWGHPSNSGQRMRALLRAVRYQVQARLLGRRAVARLGERSRLWVDPHRTAASMVLYANPPDLPEMLAWRLALRDGGLFIDVGANVGTYTIWAAELGAEVIALEPAADTFSLLWENIALNGYQVTAVQAAAGDHCGTARFTAGLDAGNRLALDGPVVTELVTVDSLIGRRWVAGMKVDVEGFEIDVLRGAARALADHRIGLIQVEWNEMSTVAVNADRRPIADLLASYDYGLYRPDKTGCLVPLTEPEFGADVFARPTRKDARS